MRYNWHEENDWNHSLLRCLHVCFLPRSSNERIGSGYLNMRRKRSEKNAMFWWGRLMLLFKEKWGKEIVSKYKAEKYMRGLNLDKNATPFFTL